MLPHSRLTVMYWLHVDGGMGMDEGRYFRELASRCYELGRACFDLDISLQLNEIGDELLLNATKLDAADSVNSRLILIEGSGSKRTH
jgi:hypothetical protein